MDSDLNSTFFYFEGNFHSSSYHLAGGFRPTRWLLAYLNELLRIIKGQIQAISTVMIRYVKQTDLNQ